MTSSLRRLLATAVVVLTVFVFVSPAQAAGGWKDQAWRDMRSLAPEGATETGRSATLLQVSRTCTYLNNGYRASWVLDMYFTLAQDSANSRRELSDMYTYSMALMAVAGTRLCSRHRYQISRALDF